MVFACMVKNYTVQIFKNFLKMVGFRGKLFLFKNKSAFYVSFLLRWLEYLKMLKILALEIT